MTAKENSRLVPKPPVLKRYGPYFLLDRIGVGGMAEIFRARPAKAEANGRIIVVKRLLPEIMNEPGFLQMFRAEIQVSMSFSHPNTVQIHDFGTADGRPYLAMEYVRGRNLRTLGKNYERRGERPPLLMSVYVAMKAACGLHYAHTFVNKATGEQLHLVHRDVSPQNILVSCEGEVKVIDFGVAKANLRGADPTQPGTIKGKLNYLSPEQVGGEPVDARSDVFSLGIVLWELLTGRRLFAGDGNETAHATLKRIRELGAPPRPSAYNPDIPPQLDKTVMTALERAPNDRYPTADAFAQELQTFLRRVGPQYGSNELAAELERLLGDELVEDDRRLKELNEQSQRVILSWPGAARGDARTLIVRPQAVDARTGIIAPKTRFLTRTLRKALHAIQWSMTRALIPIWILLGWNLGSQYLNHHPLFAPKRHISLAASAPPPALPASAAPAPFTVPIKMIAVRFHLPKSVKPRAHAVIRVNDHKIEPAYPLAVAIANVALDQPFTVEVDLKDYRPFRRNYVLSSQEFKGLHPAPVDLTLPLKAKGKRRVASSR